jgi:RNA polymerase sigma-70 factor (ECF subfamily)
VTEELAHWLPQVYRFALRLTGDLHRAEDLAQETLLRAWSRREQLREGKATRVWLFRIAANLWRDTVRRRGVPVGRPESLHEDCPSTAPPLEQRLVDQEELQVALSALDSLPPRQREVLYLNACEELSVQEIADILGISPAAAKASLSLARQRLRQELAPTLFTDERAV